MKLTPYTLLLILAAQATAAKPLMEWRFDDPSGTPTSELANTGRLPGAWNGDLENTFTNGEGHLVVRRTPQSAANVFVPVVLPAGTQLPGDLWILVDVAGWNFRGNVANETMRVGFSHTRHAERPSVVAQIRLGRVGADQVSVAAEGFGEGAEETTDLPLFRAEQVTPLTLVLHVNRAENTFTLNLRQQEGGAVMFLGSGAISPDREIQFVRLGFTGHFGAREEFLHLSRVAVLTENPFE